MEVKQAKPLEPSHSFADLSQAVLRLSGDLQELRELLMRSPCDVGERVWRFCHERVWRILRGEAPLPLRDGPSLVLHVVPQVAFGQAPMAVDLAAAEFLIFGSGGSPTFDADGRLFWPENRGEVGQNGYAHMTRAGCIEAVKVLSERRDASLPPAAELRLRYVERLLVEGAREYLGSLAKLRVGGEITLAASLIRVKGLFGTTGLEYDAGAHYRVPIARDLVMMPSVQVADAGVQGQELSGVLRPALDVLWQMCGMARCMSFDTEGNYRRA